MWRQKSRELWLKAGDKNSKFFHLSTIIRRRRTNIDAIKLEDGQWITNSNSIRKLFYNNFKEHFKEEPTYFPTHLNHLILPCITKDKNHELIKIPTLEEFKSTLFQMQDLKAPGPDGFPVIFYKQLWPSIGDDVIRVVIYKVISKLLVAKLRPHLDKIISPSQSAFIPNRWIAENQVIVQDVLHSFKTRKTKPGLMAIKLDLQKAYDGVNWRFIQAILLHLGFNETFTNWILACISSLSFEVLVNKGKAECFKLSKGLRQGDPLSSYLFILGQEVLSRLLDNELRCKNIDEIKTNISGSTITHVMYAVDIVLFSKTSKKNATNLVNILDKYCKWSGQCQQQQVKCILF